MTNILLVSGHPNLDASYANKAIIDHFLTQHPTITLHRLDQVTPNFHFDLEVEQKVLKNADIIILQFPFHWYSVPALMKKWIDDVFSYGFAFGPEGDKLKGKDFILSFSVGGPKDSYSPLGYNHFTVLDFLKPLEQTAYLAGMTYHPPIYTNSMIYIPDVYNTLEGVQERARDHAQRLSTKVTSLFS